MQSHYQKVQQRLDRKLILNRMKSITFLSFKFLNQHYRLNSGSTSSRLGVAPV